MKKKNPTHKLSKRDMFRFHEFNCFRRLDWLKRIEDGMIRLDEDGAICIFRNGEWTKANIS